MHTTPNISDVWTYTYYAWGKAVFSLHKMEEEAEEREGEEEEELCEWELNWKNLS